MTKEQAIQQAGDLNLRWPDVPWCVIARPGGIFVPKMIHSSLNGQRIGIDYQESDVVWRP